MLTKAAIKHSTYQHETKANIHLYRVRSDDCFIRCSHQTHRELPTRIFPFTACINSSIHNASCGDGLC